MHGPFCPYDGSTVSAKMDTLTLHLEELCPSVLSKLRLC